MRTCFLPKLASDLRQPPSLPTDALPMLPVELPACARAFDLDLTLWTDPVPSRDDDDEGAGPG